MATEQDIVSAAEVIREGGLVAFPTETVYGLGANALDTVAVSQIFELKRRPRFDPLIVHVASPDELQALVEQVPQAAVDLIARFWPGPLSVVLPKRECLREAAVNLLAAVRRLDVLELDYILARPVPETGLGHAIMDRLRRASIS